MTRFDKIKNFIGFDTITPVLENKKNIGSAIVPLQLQRIRQDTASWRLSVEEAERAYFPYRVQMQTLYIDTILNGHVKACIEKRKDLTLLRDWQIVDNKGNVNEDLAIELDKKWFNEFLNLSLDAIYFGYTLISLGDLQNGNFKDIQTVKRWNVSPDRKIVSNVPYNPTGISWEDEQYRNWHVYIKTSNDIGTSNTGFGLLYNVGIYEIFLRNILGYNGDFVELFSQPFRIGRTNKTNEQERENFHGAVRDMGSAGYAILDDIGDDITFLEMQQSGTAWKGYENLELRLENKISKIILGHSDAMDSTAGKLGATQGADSPTDQALEDKQTKDGVFVTDIINTDLFPRLRNLGFKIPENCKFEFKNDAELNETNHRFTALAVEIKKAGLQVDKAYFEEQTGIKLSEVVAKPLPITPADKIQNRLNELYR